jgi:hypothetical protein
VFLGGRGVGRLEPGQRVKATVTASFDYDLLARTADG